jgi:hypothetical protein
MSELNTEAVEVIEQLGGNAKTAELCDVSRAAVSQWRHNGIPKAQRRFLKSARPDVFQEKQPGSDRADSQAPAPGPAH